MIINIGKKRKVLLFLTGLISPLAFSASQPTTKITINWTGFYAGINSGYTTSNSKKLNINAFNIQADPNGSGSIAGMGAAAASGTGNFPLIIDGFIGGGGAGWLYFKHQ